MNDEELIRSLRRLDRPVPVDPAFGEALLERLRRERRRPGAGLPPLLAAAALLGVALVGGALLAGQAPERSDGDAVLPSPSPQVQPSPSLVPLPSDIVLDLADAITLAGLAGASGHIYDFEAVADALWFNAQDNSGAQGVLIRLDAVTGEVRRFPGLCGIGGCVRPPVEVAGNMWTLKLDPLVKGPILVRFDPAGVAEPEEVRIGDGSYFEARWLAPAGEDGLWVGRPDGAYLVTTDGTIQRSIDAPFEPRPETGYDETMIPVGPTFGTLWAYDAAEALVYRLDPADGTVTARISLDCPTIDYHKNYGGHAPLVYPVTGVSGTADSMAASCPMSTDHEYPGPLSLIDPATNRVVAEVDMGRAYGRGVVFNGGWWVPLDGGTISRGDESSLVRIDPTTGAVVSSVVVPMSPARRPIPNAVTAGGALWLWIRTGDSSIAGDTIDFILRVAPEELPS